MLTFRTIGLAMLTFSLAAASAAYAAPAPGPTGRAVRIVPSTPSQSAPRQVVPMDVQADRKPLDGVLVAPDCGSVTCKGGRTGTSTGAGQRTLVAPGCGNGCRTTPVAYIGETEKNRNGGTRPAVG